MSGRNPPSYCTLTLIAMQGHQQKGRQTNTSSNNKDKSDTIIETSTAEDHDDENLHNPSTRPRYSPGSRRRLIVHSIISTTVLSTVEHLVQQCCVLVLRCTFKVAVNTIVPRSPFFLFLYLKTQTVTHIRKHAVEYLRQWNGAICVIYNLCQRQKIR